MKGGGYVLILMSTKKARVNFFFLRGPRLMFSGLAGSFE